MAAAEDMDDMFALGLSDDDVDDDVGGGGNENVVAGSSVGLDGTGGDGGGDLAAINASTAGTSCGCQTPPTQLY